MLAFAKRLPKIELHAHLSGSISSKSLELMLSDGVEDTQEIRSILNKGKFRSVDDCIGFFAHIHKAIDSYERLYKATQSVVTEFFEDGVVYLELRTAPRILNSNDLSIDTTCIASCHRGYSTYIETVMKAVDEICRELHHKIIVRLLVSVDRRLSLEQVNILVDICLDFKRNHYLGKSLICGMDLSSFPKAGGLPTFLPGLKRARHNGLPLALHLAEVCDQDETELRELLLIPASRIGHATFLHTHYPSLLKIVDELDLVMELCLTSNIKCQSVSQYEKHHLNYWWHRPRSKICICTDDKGVFECHLSEELTICAELLQLKEVDLWNLQKQSIEYAFCDDECKAQLREQLENWKKENVEIA